MVELVDPSGLICGYEWSGGVRRPLVREDIEAALSACVATSEAPFRPVVWLHFNLADQRAWKWIETCGHLPEAAREALLGTGARMWLEPVGRGIAGVLGDLHHELHDEPGEVGALRLYVDDRYMISARRQPLLAVDRLRHAVDNGLVVDRPIVLLVHLLHHLADGVGDLSGKLTADADKVEDRILTGRMDDQGAELGRIRRMTARLKRILVPQQSSLHGLPLRLPPAMRDDAATVREVSDRLDTLGHDLDLVQERARLLQDELSSRLMEATNRNLYVLSIVTVIFLPMTLVSGIFGMNLGGMPGVQSDVGFWWGISLIVVTAAVSIFAMRRSHLI